MLCAEEVTQYHSLKKKKKKKESTNRNRNGYALLLKQFNPQIAIAISE